MAHHKIQEVAPAELIIADYLSVLNNVDLRMGLKYAKLLLIQTIEGHAQEGHGKFQKQGCGYTSTTLDDIVDALSTSNNEQVYQGIGEITKNRIRELRDEVLDILKSPFERILKGENVKSLTDKKGKPLLGIDTLREAKIENNEAFFLGGYLASKMDSYDPWRKKVEEKYGISMGGGECVAVDMEKMPENLTLDDLSETEWGKALDILKKEGIIVDIEKKGVSTGIDREYGKGKIKKIKSSDKIKNAYIRHKIGKGVSDDAAIIIAGKLYGEEAFWGAFLLDAIDTWDKYATWIFEGGMDEALGNKLRKHINMSDKELEEKTLEFIYLARNGPGFPDSSQRYFLEINQDIDQTALESHLRFLRGEQFKEMGIGYRHFGKRKLKNTIFYEKIKQRLKKV